MSDISIGQNGSSVFLSGTGSGFDTRALIDAAVAQKTQRADRIDVTIDDNEAKAAAYDELLSLTSGLQSATGSLRSVFGFSDTDTSVYDSRSGVLSSSSATDPLSLVNVAIDEGTELGNYEIEVQQRAETMQTIGANQTSATDPLNLTGSFNLGLSGGSSGQIDITNGMSLNDVAAAINAQRDTTGVRASVVQVSETEFTLSLTGDETNQNITTSSVSGDNVLANLGLTDGAGAFTNVTRAAQEAIVAFDGVTITRDSNTFANLAQGITIDVKAAEPGTIISLEVSNDIEATKEAITSFVEAHNSLRDFFNQNQKVSGEGVVAEDAVLFGDFTLESLNTALSSVISSGNADLSSLRDIGIAYDNNNRLTVDEAALDDAILNDFQSVQNIFATNVSTSNPSLGLISNSSSVAALDFTLDITTDGGGNITDASVGGDSSLFTVSGSTIKGASGTIYQGLTFSYSAGVDAAIDVNINQGVANRLNNVAEGYTDPVSGLVTRERLNLLEQNQDLSQEASEIRSRAEDFRDREIQKFARMEQQLARLELLRDQLSLLFGNNDD